MAELAGWVGGQGGQHRGPGHQPHSARERDTLIQSHPTRPETKLQVKCLLECSLFVFNAVPGCFPSTLRNWAVGKIKVGGGWTPGAIPSKPGVQRQGAGVLGAVLGDTGDRRQMSREHQPSCVT